MSNEKIETVRNIVNDAFRRLVLVKPRVSGTRNTWGNWHYECPECATAIDYCDRYCRKCGVPFRWDDNEEDQ